MLLVIDAFIRFHHHQKLSLLALMVSFEKMTHLSISAAADESYFKSSVEHFSLKICYISDVLSISKTYSKLDFEKLATCNRDNNSFRSKYWNIWSNAKQVRRSFCYFNWVCKTPFRLFSIEMASIVGLMRIRKKTRKRRVEKLDQGLKKQFDRGNIT